MVNDTARLLQADVKPCEAVVLSLCVLSQNMFSHTLQRLE